MFGIIKRLFTREKPEEKSAAVTACRSCGKQISYDTSRGEVPEFCPECIAKARSEHGMITRTCKGCGKTFTLPEEVQHWPDYCQECRRKYQIVQQITRKCRGCGKEFTFPSNIRHWPNYCRDCQSKRKDSGYFQKCATGSFPVDTPSVRHRENRSHGASSTGPASCCRAAGTRD